MIGTLNFVLRTQKTLKNGKAPLYLSYSLHKARLFASLDKSLYSQYWDKNAQCASFVPKREAKKIFKDIPENELLNETEIKEINNIIKETELTIEEIENRFIALKIQFSSQMVIDALKNGRADVTKKEEPNNLLFDFMDGYILDHQHTRERTSLSTYRSIANHLKAFQEDKKLKVTFESIDFAFFTRFQNYLLSKTKTDKEGNTSHLLNNTTVAKILSTLKTFLGYASKQGIKVNPGYKDFTVKSEKLEVIALTQQEFDSLLNLDLSDNKRLDKVRDLFCFSCATGLRFSDISQLGREHLGNSEINITVVKTKTELTVPLNAISGNILDKYKGFQKPLPIISNQKGNDYLKELCKLAGIDKQVEIVRFHGKKRIVKVHPKYELIHFHTGRKTFVTLSLEKGMSAEEVMKITGHDTYQSFKRYLQVTKERQKAVMVKAWGAVNNLKIVG